MRVVKGKVVANLLSIKKVMVVISEPWGVFLNAQFLTDPTNALKEGDEVKLVRKGWWFGKKTYSILQ